MSCIFSLEERNKVFSCSATLLLKYISKYFSFCLMFLQVVEFQFILLCREKCLPIKVIPDQMRVMSLQMKVICLGMMTVVQKKVCWRRKMRRSMIHVVMKVTMMQTNVVTGQPAKKCQQIRYSSKQVFLRMVGVSQNLMKILNPTMLLN